MMHNRIALVLAAGLALAACQKTKTPVVPEEQTQTTELANGFPDNAANIHAYLFAAFVYNGNSSFNNTYVTSYCAFRDPSGDLLSTYNHITGSTNFNFTTSDAGNIDVGNVQFNNQQLFENNTGNAFFYRNSSSFAAFSSLNPQWVTQGNGPIKPLNLTITRGFPKFAAFPSSSTNYTLSAQQGFTLPVSGNYSNFDSVSCAIGYPGSTNSVRKSVAAGASSIVFSAADLSPVGSNFSMPFYITLFNYSNMTIDSRKHVFELSTQYAGTAYITQ